MEGHIWEMPWDVTIYTDRAQVYIATEFIAIRSYTVCIISIIVYVKVVATSIGKTFLYLKMNFVCHRLAIMNMLSM